MVYSFLVLGVSDLQVNLVATRLLGVEVVFTRVIVSQVKSSKGRIEVLHSLALLIIISVVNLSTLSDTGIGDSKGSEEIVTSFAEVNGIVIAIRWEHLNYPLLTFG